MSSATTEVVATLMVIVLLVLILGVYNLFRDRAAMRAENMSRSFLARCVFVFLNLVFVSRSYAHYARLLRTDDVVVWVCVCIHVTVHVYSILLAEASETVTRLDLERKYDFSFSIVAMMAIYYFFNDD